VSRWQEVGDGCFRRRYEEFDLNIGVVRGSDALLVLDTRADLRQADELLRDLRHFGRPVRWVVNSHWHFDHTFGNQRFVEAARGEGQPDAAGVADDVELWGHRELPEQLLGDEPQLRADLRARFGDEAGDEYDRVVLTAPDHLVTERAVLDLGDRAVELVHFGRGHTRNDLVVTIPAAGVVFAGDLLEESAPPAFGDDCFPLEWPDTARALVGGGATVYVPGHGDVMDPVAAREQAGELASMASLIRELFDAGVPVAGALHEAGDRWPYPADALVEAVARGYAALASDLR
jgi:glyoxylase-like metal-dependent hydrolase (beta-lactamase superfamily II)